MIIYRYTSKTTGKCYIGQTIKTIEKRFDAHVWTTTKTSSNAKFSRAIRKHGKDDFVGEILESCENKGDMNKKEIFWINYYNSMNAGYNSTIGGEGVMPGMVSARDNHGNKFWVSSSEYKRDKNLVTNNSGKIQKRVLCYFCNEFYPPTGAMYHNEYCKSNPNRLLREVSCKDCKRLFKDNTGLGNHKFFCKDRSKHITRVIKCKFCNKGYKDHRNKKQHEDTCVLNKKRSFYYCDFCNKSVGNKSAKVKHQKMCELNLGNKIKIWNCKFCNKEFKKTIINLSNHEKFYCKNNPQALSPPVLSCTCGRVYTDKGNYTQHIRKCYKYLKE